MPHISFCKGFLHVLFVCAYYTTKKAACSKTFQTFCFALNTISLFIVCSSTTRCSVRRMGKGPLKTSRKRREKGVFISREDVCSSPLFSSSPSFAQSLHLSQARGKKRGKGPFLPPSSPLFLLVLFFKDAFQRFFSPFSFKKEGGEMKGRM